MIRALFAGEINVDVIMSGMESPPVVDREVTAQTWDVVMGGSTMITACAYASLGGHAAFTGLAGADEYGDFMLRGMAGFGIDTALVRRSAEVRTGVTVNMIHANTRTQATYPGTIAEFDGSWLDAAALGGFQHLHFGGVYLETRLLPNIARLLETARELGLTTSMDPQWDASGEWRYMDQWLPLLSFLFVNDAEAASLARVEGPEQACRSLARRTACPIVKAGKDGCWTTEGRVPVTPVQPVDTTGAGDTFDAAFLYATLERRMPLREAAAFANAAAARSTLFIGGVTARSTYDDVIAIMRSWSSTPMPPPKSGPSTTIS
jgi:sugar/nucleoside kinase (ribokinase family)